MSKHNLGVVVIGRNEGARLSRCLASACVADPVVVYVDSASSDDSLVRARSFGVHVVELDMSMPFSAARARNAGVEKLLQVAPGTELVQFVDGDCELDRHWIDSARVVMEQDARLAIVCGRRRERFPEASLYNRLCDIEWDTPVGILDACGGDFLVRLGAFSSVGGFDPTVIAGEEPELCYRLRAAGWQIRRIDAEMTLHDAAITRFRQWWTRVLRGGYAYALVCALHFRDPGYFRLRNVISICVWGGAVPLGALLLSVVHPALLVPVVAAYSLRFLRLRRWAVANQGLDARTATIYGAALVAGRFAEFAGVLCCWRDLLLKRQRRIIEYKDVG